MGKTVVHNVSRAIGFLVIDRDIQSPDYEGFYRSNIDEAMQIASALAESKEGCIEVIPLLAAPEVMHVHYERDEEDDERDAAELSENPWAVLMRTYDGEWVTLDTYPTKAKAEKDRTKMIKKEQIPAKALKVIERN